jgi:transcription antitermination factor NusG
MSSIQFIESVTPQLARLTTHWYAIQTRAKHEKKVATELRGTGINVFLPLLTEKRQWSDRRMTVDVPLFSCYLFVNVDSSAEARISILRAAGVLRFVGGHHKEAAIPDGDIESINILLAKKVPFVSHSFLEIGQRVRIRGGALDGVEGVLTKCNGKNRLALSVDTIQRSLSISLEGYQVEPIGPVRRVC